MSMGDLEAKSDLKNKIAILKVLFSDLDNQYLSSSNRTLLNRVINEIETWVDGDGESALEYDAQLALIFASGCAAAKYEQSDYNTEDSRKSLEAYLSILKILHAADSFVDEEREILSIVISDCEGYLNTPIDTITTLDRNGKLDMLHSICDNYVARYSVELAMKVIRDDPTANPNQVLFRNIDVQEAMTPQDRTRRGIAATQRFERFGHTRDLEEGLKHFSEAVALTPRDSPDWPEVLANEGQLLTRRFERFGEVKDIDSAIERQIEAVNLTPFDSPDRPIWLNNLGVSFLYRFKRFSKVKDIDEAIERQTEAINLTPLNSPNHPGWLSNLGLSLTYRFERFGEVKDLEIAIERQTEAVNFTPLDIPARPERLNSLGASFMYRFERFGEVKDLNAAIGRYVEAVDLTPLDNPNLPIWLHSLGISLVCRFERFGEVKDLDAAIEKQTEAISLTPVDSPHRPARLSSLGGSLICRFGRFGELKDIEGAIGRETEAVDLTPLDSPYRPDRLNTLGVLLMRRFERFGEVKDVDAAIGRQTEAVNLIPLDNPHRSVGLLNLGNSLMCRFERFSEAKDLDAAIGRQIEAVNITPLDSPYRPSRLSGLGSSLMCRFERFGEAKDIEAAIGRHTEAVDLIPLDSPDRPIGLTGLGISLMYRFERFGEVKDIDAAIGRQIEAVDLTPFNSPDLSARLNNLACSLQSRFERFSEVKDLDAAIERHTEAVNLTQIDNPDHTVRLNNLGESFICHFRRFGDTVSLNRAADIFRSSYASSSGFPIHRIHAALQFSEILHTQNDFPSASEAYNCAVHLLPQTIWIGLDAVSQLNQLTSRIQSFGSDAVACMISMAESEPGQKQQHLGHAIEVLDQTQSILWSQASKPRQNLQELKAVDPQLAEQLDYVGSILRKGSFRDSSTALTELEEQQYRRSAEQWEEIVLEVRKLPGFDRFLLPLPISELRKAANGGPVIVINVSKYRSDALVIPSHGNLELLPLASDTATLVEQLAEQQHNILISGCSRDGHFWDDTSNTQDESVIEVLYQAWTLLREPITEKLKKCGILRSESSSMPRIWWCLTGQATFIPIHASLPRPVEESVYSKGMMDLVISSYTPTLSTLARTQRHQPRSESIRMLAIGQPESQGQPSLSFVEEEIQLIRGMLPDQATVLDNSNATIDAVSVALPEHTWVHFACHGIQDHNKPLESGLVLYNDRILTLSRLAQYQLKVAEFAFLSSCQSATGSELKPNESVHLAGGLQFLGFRGVIGTMWSVEDKDAMYIAKVVYDELFKHGVEQARASNAAAALHLAVRRLRDEEKVPVNRWVPFIHFGF